MFTKRRHERTIASVRSRGVTYVSDLLFCVCVKLRVIKWKREREKGEKSNYVEEGGREAVKCTRHLQHPASIVWLRDSVSPSFAYSRHCFKWLHSIWPGWFQFSPVILIPDASLRVRENARVVWLIACVPLPWSPHLHLFPSSPGLVGFQSVVSNLPIRARGWGLNGSIKRKNKEAQRQRRVQFESRQSTQSTPLEASVAAQFSQFTALQVTLTPRPSLVLFVQAAPHCPSFFILYFALAYYPGPFSMKKRATNSQDTPPVSLVVTSSKANEWTNEREE